jgi:hypothetical protein
LPVSSAPSSPTRSAEALTAASLQQHTQQQQSGPQQPQHEGSVVVELSPPESPLCSPFVAPADAPWGGLVTEVGAGATRQPQPDCAQTPGRVNQGK